MEELIEFNSLLEKEFIERKYESATRRKFFKITWYHRGLLELPDEVVVQKTWILGAHGQVWYYRVYANGKISPLKTHLIFEGDMLWLEDLLDQGFDEQSECCDQMSGEGFEMVRYHANGKIRSRFCGSLFGNEYLQEVARRVDLYVMRKWVLVEKKRVW